MAEYRLAIDIGASSGRHILGKIENGSLLTEEVYRFDNGIVEENGSLIWDIEKLENEVLTGLKKCAEISKIPSSVAIDTWGVDYVLLDKNGEIIFPVYSYRDGRTNGSFPAADAIVPRKDLFFRTGIQTQKFNTVYQLFSDKTSGRLERAAAFLMIPDYLSFCLTGIRSNEYTNATTTNLINAYSGEWDADLIERFGFPPGLFFPLSKPGKLIGGFNEKTKRFCGFDSKVLFCPSHDTASAVAACPLGDDCSAYISSGTWSLFGIESRKPIITPGVFEHNFTNEGGIEGRFRVLKNYMGMWLLQSIRRDLGKKISYDEMMKMAENCKDHLLIDVNDPGFVSPRNMTDAIRNSLKEPRLSVESVISTVYHSLARSYSDALKETEKITGQKINKLHVIGGGSKDGYLNRLTAEETGVPVVTGPVEATSTGNLISQFISSGEIRCLDDARKLIEKSFSVGEEKI